MSAMMNAVVGALANRRKRGAPAKKAPLVTTGASPAPIVVSGDAGIKQVGKARRRRKFGLGGGLGGGRFGKR
jgi:hypothetical protein